MKLHEVTLFACLSVSLANVRHRNLQEDQGQATVQPNHIPMESRIVGGVQTSAGEYPFFVQGNGCGASLVAKDVALTAGHCKGVFINQDVYIGNYIFGSTSGGAEKKTVTEERRHNLFNGQTLEYDYMLLKLDSPVSSASLIPIALNENASNPSSGEMLTVIGFGSTYSGGSLTSRLMEVDVPYVDAQTCNSLYGAGEINDNLMLCAGFLAGGKDSCQGDSGGPIFDSSGVQVGVVSWGNGCAEANYPGVYSRISGGIDWIKQNICAMSSDPPTFCGIGTGTGSTGGSNSTSITKRVTIEVKHDNYPTETGWILKDSTGKTFASQATGSVTTDGALVSKSVSLPAGTYTFSMTDYYGDGICCSYGYGYFKITADDGTVLVSDNGQFSSSITKTFDIATSTTGGTTGSGGGTSTTVQYYVTVQYDNWPGELSWFIKDVATNAKIINYLAGDVATQMALITKQIALTPGKAYALSLHDSYGDGICCSYGYGYAEVFAMIGSDKVLLATSDGQFGSRQTKRFTVPSNIGRAFIGSNVVEGSHTKQPKTKCNDSAGTFFVSDSIGDQDCEWLSSTIDSFDFLCQLIDVGSVCPHTCDLCNLFG